MEARPLAQDVPAFDSLMPPVKGDLAPTEIRDDVEAEVPVMIPGAKTTLFAELRG
jgi:hypothetical protein